MSETREERMPVVFVGHGSPMNAIEDNRWSRGFTALGQALPRPRAIQPLRPETPFAALLNFLELLRAQRCQRTTLQESARPAIATSHPTPFELLSDSVKIFTHTTLLPTATSTASLDFRPAVPNIQRIRHQALPQLRVTLRARVRHKLALRRFAGL